MKTKQKIVKASKQLKKIFFHYKKGETLDQKHPPIGKKSFLKKRRCDGSRVYAT